MTFDQEWAELTGEASARLRLAGAGEPGGAGAQGELRQSRRAWSQAAEGVRAVGGDLRAAVGGLSEGQRGAGGADAAVAGLLSATVQASVFQSWKHKVELMRRECDEVRGKMTKAAQAYYQTNDEIKDAFEKRDTTSDDRPEIGRPTPGEGGQSRW
ncbi:hypothetical protein [Streptomyces sp. NPDC057702]|uniref:hypothetical protein n=1 Tax=unclassified Streptomyces TaxID=2593676 RepID=UPI0036B00ADB